MLLFVREWVGETVIFGGWQVHRPIGRSLSQDMEAHHTICEGSRELELWVWGWNAMVYPEIVQWTGTVGKMVRCPYGRRVEVFVQMWRCFSQKIASLQAWVWRACPLCWSLLRPEEMGLLKSLVYRGSFGLIQQDTYVGRGASWTCHFCSAWPLGETVDAPYLGHFLLS